MERSSRGKRANMGRERGKALRSIHPDMVKDLRKKLKALPKLEPQSLSKKRTDSSAE